MTKLALSAFDLPCPPMAYRDCQCTRKSEPLHSTGQARPTDAKFKRPIGGDHAASPVLDPHVAAFVPCLIMRGCPETVLRAVGTCVVPPLNRAPCWRLSHILHEGFDHQPRRTHRDPPTAVPRVRLMRRICATSNHPVPDTIGSRVGLPVRLVYPTHGVATQASTTVGFDAQARCRYHKDGSAGTSTRPTNVLPLVRCTTYHEKSSHLFPGAIKEFHTVEHTTQ